MWIIRCNHSVSLSSLEMDVGIELPLLELRCLLDHSRVCPIQVKAGTAQARELVVL